MKSLLLLKIYPKDPTNVKSDQLSTFSNLAKIFSSLKGDISSVPIKENKKNKAKELLLIDSYAFHFLINSLKSTKSTWLF